MSMKVIEQLREMQADSNALFVKLHNFHWNIKGIQFNAIHAYTEALYEKMATIYDDTAERVLQLGGKPILTLEEIAKTTRIETEKGDCFEAKYVLDAIFKDLTFLLNEWKKISDLSSKDQATSNMADDQIKFLEKELWILRSTISK